MRILHFAGIINRYDFIDNCLSRLDRARYQVHALTLAPARQAIPHTAEQAYPTRCLNILLARRSFPRILWELVSELRRLRADVLHAHHFDEAFLGSLATRLARVPYFVVGRHWSEHVYVQTRGWKRAAVLGVESFFNAHADRIVVPIQADADLLTSRQSVPRRKVHVVPYGFDINRARVSSPTAPTKLRRELGLNGSYMALACCRLNPEKGLPVLLHAIPTVVARQKDFRLVIVGGGPCESDLKRLAVRLGIQDVVHFVGWRDDAMDWMASSDLVIQPSLSESFCQVLVEALGFKKPVIMTPVGAAPDIIGRNERGMLVPVGDSTTLADTICQLTADRGLGRRLGESGYEYMKQHYSPESCTRDLEEMYDQMAHGRRAS
jgi:glycosyltransferase involved in cell wall biosynthesis